MFEEYKDVNILKINNKSIKIKKIDGIRIINFRTILDREIKLGNHITIISGKNGTMKSSILGLIAHPFVSENSAIDCFNKPLKTDLKDVFSLSAEKDNVENGYNYEICFKDTNDNKLKENVRIYKSSEKHRDFRIDVGGRSKENGFFYLNTSFVSLNRLIPIVDTNAQKNPRTVDKDLLEFISEGYQKIMTKSDFMNTHLVSEKNRKYTFAPSDESIYDYKSISTGEDNIGYILNKLYSFKKYSNDINNRLQGILCIDEIENSLHPTVLSNLLNYLYNFSCRYNIQIVLTSHSLYLLQLAIELREKNKKVLKLIL